MPEVSKIRIIIKGTERESRISIHGVLPTLAQILNLSVYMERFLSFIVFNNF